MGLGFGWAKLQHKVWRAVSPAYRITGVFYTGSFDKLGGGAVCDSIGLLPTFRTSLTLTVNTNKTV